MNLRLRPDVEEAVRREAARVGRSQQEVIREVDEAESEALTAAFDQFVASDALIVFVVAGLG